MPYVALYRKYRSQTFDEVVGQQHVTTVLQNALRLGRVAHAYLLCGPRGCGKTTTARLLARALNCTAADAPTPSPCGVCELCTRIRDGACMDVVEMDAASETGIDDVREKIIENARYMPVEARYKVYIVDEVHDLSLKAFDSLLKTLEEPPAHVVFILATTEAHKVPITIRSRCQRLDFRRGAMPDLAANLTHVLDAEGLQYEREAVEALARAAEGSYRDSLSLLEQVLAYTDGALTAQAVYSAIGTVGPELLDGLTEVIASDDMAAALRRAGEVVEAGKDVKQLLVSLQTHLRDLLVASVATGPRAFADVTEERFGQLKQQACRFTPPHLLRMLDVLAAAERDLRFSSQHRLLFERALLGVLPSSLAAETRPAVAAPVAPAPPPAPRAALPGPAAGTGAPPARVRPEPAPVEPPPAPAAPVAPPEGGEPGRFADGIDLEGLRRVWPNVRRRILSRSRAAAALFGEEEVLALEGNVVVLCFPTGFAVERFETPRARESLERALAEEIGPGYRVRCVPAAERSARAQAPVAPPAPAPTLELPAEPEPTPAPARDVVDGPAEPELFDLVMEEFDGTEVTDD